MTDKEKLEIQGRRISELLEENDELKANIKLLVQDNQDLMKDKSELELSLIDEKREVEEYIEQYKTLVKEMKDIKKEYLKAKTEYVKAIVDVKGKINKLTNKIKT